MANLCKFCNKEINGNRGTLTVHERNCKSNPEVIKRLSGNCDYCGKHHNGLYGSGRFCSSKCARGFSTKAKRKEINEAVSKTLTKPVITEDRLCLICDSIFNIDVNSNVKCCSRKCSSKLQVITLRERDPEHYVKLGRKGASSQNKRSKNEMVFYDLCYSKFNNVIHNEPMFNGWDADVILLDEKIAISWNGKWHYEKITEKHSIKQVQNRDKIKDKVIKQYGFKHYIIKDMGSYNPVFVHHEFEKFIEWFNLIK